MLVFISRKKGGADMAVNFTALNTVYNHYLTSYAPKSSSPYDTHKKSELRGIYNSIVKLNKESPLYLLETDKKTTQYAVGLKENARGLRNTIASLGGLDEEAVLSKKIAYSENESLASAKFIAAYDKDTEYNPIDIQVKQLAAPQVNMGNFLTSDTLTMEPDTYSFDIKSNDLSYEFQFKINEHDTNLDVQNRLSRLITNAEIGVNASVMEDGEGNSSLRLESSSTGIPLHKQSLFTVSDTKTSKTSGTVDYLGIREATSHAANAVFVINGEEHRAFSNSFILDNMYEITLHSISRDENDTTSIGIKNDFESLNENMNHFIKGFNTFLDTASNYSQEHPKSNRLVKEMNRIASYYHTNLDTYGLKLQENGTLDLDKQQLEKNISSVGTEELMDSMKGFSNSLLRKTSEISLNPMNYVDKTIAAYKNPGKNFATPYITSAYSGMMFNSYC